MALLYDVIDVSGRLQYISHDSLARDFEGDQLAAIHLFELPDDQDADAQLGFITAQLPTCIAGFGGSYHDGSQWVITFERGPLVDGDKRQAVHDLRLHLAHMAALNENTVWTWNAIGQAVGSCSPMDAVERTRGCWVSRTCCAGLWSRPAAIR